MGCHNNVSELQIDFGALDEVQKQLDARPPSPISWGNPRNPPQQPHAPFMAFPDGLPELNTYPGLCFWSSPVSENVPFDFDYPKDPREHQDPLIDYEALVDFEPDPMERNTGDAEFRKMFRAEFVPSDLRLSGEQLDSMPTELDFTPHRRIE